MMEVGGADLGRMWGSIKEIHQHRGVTLNFGGGGDHGPEPTQQKHKRILLYTERKTKAGGRVH
jgi:hypothetical protein